MKNKQKITWVIILVLIIGIGYAYLNSSLSIHGTTEISGNTWDIHFENVVELPDNTATVTVSPVAVPANKETELNYEIMFNTPGDVYEFVVEVVNAGTIDAMIDSFTSKIKIGDGEEQVVSSTTLPSYLTYSVTYDDDSEIEEDQILASNDRVKIKVHVEYKANITDTELEESSNKIIYLNLGINYRQST